MLAIQTEVSEELGREQVGLVVDAFVEGLSPRERKKRKRAPHSHSTGTVALTVNGVGNEDEACCGTGVVVEDAEPGEVGAQLRARTDGDQIVLFDAPAGVRGESLVGQFVRVKVESATGLSLFGTVARVAREELKHRARREHRGDHLGAGTEPHSGHGAPWARPRRS